MNRRIKGAAKVAASMSLAAGILARGGGTGRRIA